MAKKTTKSAYISTGQVAYNRRAFFDYEITARYTAGLELSLFFNDKGRAKLELGLGRGKREFDKRETIKERDWNRDKQRILSHANH